MELGLQQSSAAAPAWPGAPEPVVPPRGEAASRIENQHDRIDQGVASGQLTQGEYDRLESRLDAIDATREKDLAANGGHLTAQEKHSLNARLDNLSNSIYFDKHNLARQPGAPAPQGSQGLVDPRSHGEVADRLDRQQSRIDRGVESGQLTQGEYSHLERRLEAIDATRKEDLEANGGHLTAQEKQSLNARLNNLSDSIYFDKHNLAHQPGAPTA